MKYFFILLLISSLFNAQIINKTNSRIPSDTLVVDNGGKDSMNIFQPTIEDYTYRTEFGPVVTYDTTFTVERSYRLTQYNNKDNYGSIQFANIGSGFQRLLFRPDSFPIHDLLPERKSFFYIESDSVKYYDVKTPTTSFLYHSAMRNGAALQSTYTQNVGRNFNIALEYMGLRSEGFYTNSLAANNHTLFSANYKTVSGKYGFVAHFIHQNVNNEEYGGIKDLELFLGGDSRFRNRQNLEVNLNDSDSRFSARRYYLTQTFAPFNPEKIPFKLSHTISHQGNKYYYNVGVSDTGFYTDLLQGRSLGSKKYSNNLSNSLSALWDKENFQLSAGIKYQILELGSENAPTGSGEMAGDFFKENRLGALARLRWNLRDKIELNSFAELSRGDVFGNHISSRSTLTLEPWAGYQLLAKLNYLSTAPSFNLLTNASPIASWNYTLEDFKNQNILGIGGELRIPWMKASLYADFFNVSNYTYIDAQRSIQQSSDVGATQIGGQAHFRYGKFNLQPRLTFQMITGAKEVYPAPELIGRVNLFFQSKAFKNAAEIMTGLKVYYFSGFHSREFSPEVNEFYLPTATAYSIGNEPVVDVFFNMKVKTMQFYIEGQNLTAAAFQNRSYTAPYYPLYDFRLNIGILWHLFH